MKRMIPKQRLFLRGGSRFRGEQRSGRTAYEIEVDLKHVDLSESFLCGYLKIKNLTEEFPELTTFFEAEVIGPRHKFLTRKWDADEAIDRQHWSQFPPFRPLATQFNRDDFSFDAEASDCLFMRWKEHFLVPNHRIESVAGASFAGFYYICFSKANGAITGFYFHNSSEMFQSLVLTPVRESSFPSFEYR